MGDESEWKNLPTEEKCQHAAWRARVAGYEELIKLFATLSDEKSPEFGKYLGLVKKFVVDSNVVAQEKGLEATLNFVQNYLHAGRSAGEVCGGVVAKCLNQKPKIKRLGMDILMAYIEAEKQDVVLEELTKGLTNKQPKVVSACVETIREALRDFGTKIVPIKPLLKQLQVLLEDRDKTVREEAKLLVLEIYRWIGAALKPQLANLKPIQISELEAEFEKIVPQKAQQTRFLRSQQDLKAQMMEKAAAAASAENGDVCDSGEPAVEEVDSYELLDPVDILSKLPKDFYDKIEEKKWQERKEALEAVEKLANTPKLEQGDYNDLVRALKKVVTKDTNVMLVALAARCIALLATGLRNKFSSHAVGCIDAIIEKFKEKKTNVVVELKNAADACFPATNLEAISEVCIAALDHKTPSVKAETASFLARCFCKCTVTTLPKKLLKPFVAALLKTANDTALEVREASFEALGTAMKVVSEKAIAPFLTDVDNLKMAKIKECCEKASTVGKPGKNAEGDASKPGASQPAAAASKPPPSAKGPPKKSESAPVSTSSSSASVAGAKKKPATGKGKKQGAQKEEVVERELSDEAVDEKMSSLLPGDTLSGLASANWKERQSAMEKMIEVLGNLAKDDIPVQAFVRTVTKKPGLKDNNFSVLKMKVDLISTLAKKGNFSKRSAEYCLADLVDKIGDAKNATVVQDCLSDIAEATTLDFVATMVLSSAFEQKNPKNQSEALNWLNKALTQFGLKVNVGGTIETIKKALASANQAVRTSGIVLLGTVRIFMGPDVRRFFEGEKAALLQQIDAEFEKVKDSTPPVPTRGSKSSGGGRGGGGGVDDDEEEEEREAAGPVDIADLLPRVDISGKITDSLMTELSDKNWKVRKEALEKVERIVSEAKLIAPNVGNLTEALKQRLNDSNKILVTMTMSLCDQLMVGMGPGCRQHVKNVAPGLFANLADSKPNIRKQALDTLNHMLDQLGPTGMAAVVENEILLDALKAEKTNQRAEIFSWLAEKLPTCKKLPAEFHDCVPILYACLEDRSPEVRKAAGDAVLPFMIHCGYDPMVQKLSSIKAASRDLVKKALDQARPNLPAKPSKSASSGQVAAANQKPEPKVAAKAKVADACEVDGNGTCAPASSKPKSGKSGGVSATAQKKSSTTSVTSAAANKKKQAEEEDVGPPIKTTVNGPKEQRFKDEKNLKTLKWNFDAPRKEFVDQLQSQMELHFSKTVVDQLFHADFKQQIKAMDTLIKCCEESLDGTRANLDLLLRWITLRFFDTNTTLLLKCLEYLDVVFSGLSREEYHLDEIEAISFVPYLINKIGDPKDNIRREIRKIIQLILTIYCSPRISFFLLEGLKSKNSKQRIECLEELGNLIQVYGMERFQPNMVAALKAMAQQIGDRDNGVRSAALNAVVVAYDKHGEGIFRHIGNLNEKDMSMLEERIKRSRSNRPLAPSSSQQVAGLGLPTGVGQRQNSPDENQWTAARPPSAAASGNPRAPVAQEARRAPVVKGPFQLDFDDSDQEWNCAMPELIEPDLKEIEEPYVMPAFRNRSNVTERKSGVIPLIAQVSSLDVNRCMQALQELESILNDSKKTALQAQNEETDPGSTQLKSESLRGHVDQLLAACTGQLRTLFSRHAGQNGLTSDSIRLYSCLLRTITSVCRSKHLSNEAGKVVLRELICVLLEVLLEPKLSSMKEASGIVKEVNVTVVKLVENMNPNNIIGALVELLHEAVGSDTYSPQFLELVMKCLWKMTRMIPGIIGQLDLDRILDDVQAFLEAYPGPMWNRGNDMPVRTLKTILHTLATQKRESILDHMSLIRMRGNTDVERYIRKVLKIQREQEASTGRNATQSITDSTNSVASLGSADQEIGRRSPRISKAVQDSLAKIFQKIGCKENTNEGLNDLYDFKLRHPDADLEPFLKRSSPFFQDYINKGLKDIEAKRQASNWSGVRTATAPGAPASGPGGSLPPLGPDATPQQYLDRLKILRSKCGMDNSDLNVTITSKPSLGRPESQPSPKIGGDEVALNSFAASSPFSLSARGAHQRILGDMSQGDSTAVGSEPPQTQADAGLDELKRRYARIRNTAKE